MLLRKDAAGGNDPKYDLELWETGGASPLATLVSGATLSSDTGVVVSATWDASLLDSADGSAVELRVIGHRSGGQQSKRRTVEVGAAEWNAKLQTELELYFLRARYYDPPTGRFIGRDPIEFAQRYAYAGNNPVAYTDPAGLDCGDSWGWGDLWDCVENTAEYVGDRTAAVIGATGDAIGGVGNAVVRQAIPSIPGQNALLAWSLENRSDCARQQTLEGITFHYGCRGVVETFLLGVDDVAVTVGTDVYTYRYRLTASAQRHEACHVGQYDNYGDDFLARYFFGKWFGDPFEDAADFIDANTTSRTSLTDARNLCSGR